MRKYFLHSLFTLVLIAYSFYGHTQTGTLKGKVQGMEGGLEGATVSIANTTILSDKNGEFNLNLAPAFYKITISHSGYELLIREIKIETGNTLAFDFILSAVDQMGEVIVIGSRSDRRRTNLNSPVPVDVISSSQLLNTGQTNLTQMLNFAVPSFNASRQLTNEPVTLRGLDPDHLLILVNGTRYHNMAFMNDGRVRGTLGRGSVANDMNSIPFSAIEKIEVLRDGASAQYGSDAIAGVINIHLKRSTDKTLVSLNTGHFYKADGENLSIGINHGIAIGKKLPGNRQGFLSFSADMRYRNPTRRGGDYSGTVYQQNRVIDDSIIRARNFNRGIVSNAGTTKLNSIGISMNGGYPIIKKTELFWTAMLTDRNTFFIGSFGLPKNMRQINPLLFPDGFKPTAKQNSRDISGIAGVKGETKRQWRWEYAFSYGNNTGKYYSENTNNASQFYTLGKNAPTHFYTGRLIYQQLTNNFNFAKSLSTHFRSMKSVNLAVGAEWRREQFQMKAGEEAAWKNYDSLARKQGASQTGVIVGPDNLVNTNRNVTGAYFDIESELSEKLLIDLASRYEYYNDFGSNLSAKIAARYKLSARFSLRSSFSSGFRAPALQQKYYSSTTRSVSIIGGNLVPVFAGIFRNNSDIANAFGIPSLRPEKAINLGAGFTTTYFEHISITVDAYWIQIRNRVVLSGRFDKATNANVAAILANYPEIDQVQFFTNAVNTRTKGIDMVVHGNWELQKVKLNVMLAANFTSTRVYGPIKTTDKLPADSLNTNTLFNREERVKMEKGQPADKIILSIHYKKRKFGLDLRNTRFGKTAIVFDSRNIDRDEFFSPRLLTDLSMNYTLNKWITITVGANNLLNVYPEPLRNSLNTGEGIFIYAQEASPFGFNGGYYFLNIAFNF